LDALQPNAGTLLSPVLTNVRRIRSDIYTRGVDADAPFRLFVVGPGNSGKSSVVNALIGSQVAGVDVTPCTWRVDVYGGAGAPCVLVDYHAKAIQGTEAEMRAIVEQDERRRLDSREAARKAFAEQRRGLKREALKELRVKLRRELLHESPYVEARWNTGGPPSLDGILLVDTPGLNQADPMGREGSRRGHAVDQRAREYYTNADGVLWILDATAVAAADSKVALEEISRAFDDLGGRSDNVVGVLNRIDLVNEGDVPRVLQDCESRFSEAFVGVVPFSARLAEPGAQSEAIHESGLGRLREVIDRTFRRNAGHIRYESRRIGLLALEREVLVGLREYAQHLEAEELERCSRVDAITEQASECQRSMRDDLRGWRTRHRERIAGEIQLGFLHLYDLADQGARDRQLQRSLINVDLVTSEYRDVVRRCHQALDHFVDEAEETASFSEFRHLEVREHEAIHLDFRTAEPKLGSLRLQTPEGDFSRWAGKAWQFVKGQFGGRTKADELIEQVNRELEKGTKEVEAKLIRDAVATAKSGLLDHLEQTFTRVHLPSAEIYQVAQYLHELSAAHAEEVCSTGAAGLLVGRNETLHIEARSLFT